MAGNAAVSAPPAAVSSSGNAVAADAPDGTVAAHYGDPLREQRRLTDTAGLIERSRSVITVTGPDRLSWLHTITTQHLSNLPPWTGAEALVLSPHGHVEHHLVLADDGTTTWFDIEPGTADALLRYLTSMRFMLRVDVRDVTDDWAVASVVGPAADLPPGPYDVIARNGGGFVRRMPPLGSGVPAADVILPRSQLPGLASELTLPMAGLWAYEALRVEAARPRLGIDTDHRTLPHEVGWIGTAVHLDKGCYRGQETVARVHNLGRPPRRFVVLQLDGSVETLPARGSEIGWRERPVGVVGTTARHHELGAVALGLVKRSVPDDAELLADGVAARIDADLSPTPSEPGHARERIRPGLTAVRKTD